jgi:CubicO group peptidase (beta-lactamase class C family)
MPDFAAAAALLAQAVADHAFPAAVVEVGDTDGVRWRHAFGALTYDRGAASTNEETIFDLASLTKVIATTTFALQLVERGRIDLDEPIRERLPLWRGEDRAAVTIADLLSHSSGLPAWRPLFREHDGREAYVRAICDTPLEYAPRTRAVYSDLGFMLAGLMLERAAGSSLDWQFHRFWPDGDGSRAGYELAFTPPASWRARTAPTEYDPWRGRLLVGEVHDENAAALGGVAGHAGLFGTAPAVGIFARRVLRGLRRLPADDPFGEPDLLARFVRRTEVPGSSRALGWDTMLPTSSCGHEMSARAIGHTGFTGTSLWIDPDWDVYVVLLTNRVYPTRDNPKIQALRTALHYAIMGVWNKL